MKLKYRNGDEVSDSIGLLISILVRYPEVGSTNYDPKTKKLTLTFTISKLLDEETLRQFKKKFLSSIELFNFFEGREPKILALKYSVYEKFTILEVQRDVETITHHEIALTISLINQDFASDIVADDNSSLLEEDLELQEEMIGYALENIKDSTFEKKLIAFREEGKVLVFNKR